MSKVKPAIIYIMSIGQFSKEIDKLYLYSMSSLIQNPKRNSYLLLAYELKHEKSMVYQKGHQPTQLLLYYY